MMEYPASVVDRIFRNPPDGRGTGEGYRCPFHMWTLLAALLVLAILPTAGRTGETFTTIRHKNILLLHSYSSDYEWTRNLNEGAMSVFRDLDWSNSVRIEYMDTKNNTGDEYYEVLTALLEKKYGTISFHGIVVTDNNGMNFLGKHLDVLFKGVPVVATGINGVGTVEIPEGITSVIPEVADHAESLEQAMRLRPEAKNCFIVADTTTTGQAIMAEVRQVVPPLADRIDFHFIDQLSFDELINFAASREKGDFIYLLPYFRDKSGTVFDQGHVATSMARVATVPIFVSWDFQLNSGTLGGRVVSGNKLGEIAARKLLHLLQGETLPAIGALDDDITVSLYDFEVKNRFGLDGELFPPDAVFLNKPETFLERHRAVLIPAALLMTGLVVLLVLVLINLKKQRLINKHSRKIMSLDKEVIETQRELVTTLGEVIETRSRETGNHVKRVAAISRLLAEKVGLRREEVDIIEAASPLHDVGKIGIPDSILHSPEKLSDEEFLEMQQHTTIGKDILQYSDRELLAAACSIAYQHHERWDGTGYPEGLKGEQIHIFARITTLADVFDALSMDRCYKSAWPEERVVAYVEKESGGLFDPELVRVFFENLDGIRAIRTKFEDGAADRN